MCKHTDPLLLRVIESIDVSGQLCQSFPKLLAYYPPNTIQIRLECLLCNTKLLGTVKYDS